MLQESVEQDLQAGDGEPEFVAALLRRVQRLEETVTALQDTQALEERLLHKLAARSAAEPDTQELEQRLLDKLAKTTVSQAREMVLREAPVAAVTVRPPTPVVYTPPADESPWLLFDALNDFRLIWRMFFDLRYRFSFSTRLIVYGLLALILTSHYLWFPLAYIPFGIGSVLDKMLALVLAFFVYKALSREARRYRLFTQINPR